MEAADLEKLSSVYCYKNNCYWNCNWWMVPKGTHSKNKLCDYDFEVQSIIFPLV